MSEEGLELLITLDDPWNVRERDAFNNHQAEHAVTYWPGHPDPTGGLQDYRAEDIIGNDPFKVTSNTSAVKELHHERC